MRRVKRALKVAGIMGVIIGVVALGSYSPEAFAALAGILAFGIASSATWLYLQEIGQ